MNTEPMPDLADRALVEELARHVLGDVAPEELAIFDETAAEYHADPQGVLAASGRDEAVGFGLDLALLTPYVLAVAGSVLQFLVSTAGEEAKNESRPMIRDAVRRLLRRAKDGSGGPATSEPPTALTPEQAAQVRDVALARAHDLKLPAAQGRLLADAIVGGLNVAT